jgi:hypothetical protein
MAIPTHNRTDILLLLTILSWMNHINVLENCSIQGLYVRSSNSSKYQMRRDVGANMAVSASAR